MCSTGSKNSGHTALSSWSGYLYQGKIAIYHVLKLMVGDADIANHSLRLDCEEDFDILNGNDIVSLHQVKGKGDDTIGCYSSAFNDIKGKVETYPDTILYFHLAKGIRNTTIVEIENDYAPVEVYQYSEGKYHCTLEESDILIQGLITEYLTKIEADEYKLQDNYVTQVREKLDELVIDKVLSLHHRNMVGEGTMYQLAEQNPIAFSDFQNILQSEEITNWADSEIYVLFLAKYTFNKCLDIYLQEKEIDENTELRLRKYIGHICNMTNTEIQKFIKSLIPHKKVSFKGIKDYVGASIQVDDLRHAFYEMLICITTELNFKNDCLYWINSDSVSLSPTAIDKSGAIQKINTCNDIVKNIIETDMSVAFECQKLITTELDVESIFETANNYNKVLNNDDDTEIDFDENEHKRISRWKSISLISIDNAKNELNND